MRRASSLTLGQAERRAPTKRLSVMRSLLALVMFSAGSIAAGVAAETKPAASDSPSRGPAQPRSQVTLVSDGVTWVSITNVQPPAKFQTRTISLPPGDYEVLGRRKGYRDVRTSLHVRSGAAPGTVTVVCTESASDSR